MEVTKKRRKRVPRHLKDWLVTGEPRLCLHGPLQIIGTNQLLHLLFVATRITVSAPNRECYITSIARKSFPANKCSHTSSVLGCVQRWPGTQPWQRAVTPIHVGCMDIYDLRHTMSPSYTSTEKCILYVANFCYIIVRCACAHTL